MKETLTSVISIKSAREKKVPHKAMHEAEAAESCDIVSNSVTGSDRETSSYHCDATELCGEGGNESGSELTSGHAQTSAVPSELPEQTLSNLPSFSPLHRTTDVDTVSCSEQQPVLPHPPACRSGRIPGGSDDSQPLYDRLVVDAPDAVSDPYLFDEELSDQLNNRVSRPTTSLSSTSAASSASGNAQALNLPQSLPLQGLPFPIPKKRGRKPKKLLEAMAAAGMEVPKYKSPVRCSDTDRTRKKRDRFNGLSDEELYKLTLPDHLVTGLDIVFIGINPGVLSAFKGHHYSGPGDHFWKCLYLAGLIPEPLVAEDDFKLTGLKIGFTNVVARTTKGSQDLTRKELKEGGKLLLGKLQKFQPKIAVFNGKGIFEIFSGKKDFLFGKQPERIEGTQTNIWVMPSSSARCAQLPRALDKVPFFVALRKFRDHLNGQLTDLSESEITFQPPKKLVTVRRETKISSPERANTIDAAVVCNPNKSSLPTTLNEPDMMSLTVPIKKKRGRPRKIKFDENGQPLPEKPKVTRRSTNSSSTSLSIDTASPKKRGRPKKSNGDLKPLNVRSGSASLSGAGSQNLSFNGHALPSVYEIAGNSGGGAAMVGSEDVARLAMSNNLGYSPMSSSGGTVDYRHDCFSPPYPVVHQSNYLHHRNHHPQSSQTSMQQAHSEMFSGCGFSNSHYGQSPGFSPAAGSSVYDQSPMGMQNVNPPVSVGNSVSSMCITPPPSSPALLDQTDFDTSANMSTDTGSSSEQPLHLIDPRNKENTMDGANGNEHAVGTTGCLDQQSSFSNPSTPMDSSLQHAQSLSQTVTQSSPFYVQSMFHTATSILDHSSASTSISQSSPFSLSSAQQALPIDFSQHQTHHNSPVMSGLSPADGRVYNSPGPTINCMKSADIAAKSLSGLESLVDQIPSIGPNNQHQSHTETLPLIGARSVSPANGFSPNQVGSASGIYGVSSASSPSLYGPVITSGIASSVDSPYCGSGSAASYSPPTSQNHLQQTTPALYPTSNFSAESLASSSVAAAATSPQPHPQPAGAGFFSSSLPGGYGMTHPSAMAHMGAPNAGAIYNPYSAAYTHSPYSGFHVPSPRFPYSSAAYTASSPYHPTSTMHHQTYPGQAAVFERWRQEHMDVRFGGGF